MPPKNSIKLYLENGYYHIYNRGVEKRTVFLDDRDYVQFLHFLKYYLDPDEKIDKTTGLIHPMNLANEIVLLSYCLMPNHYHLLIKQITRESMSKFMKRLITNYSMHFNHRYDRVGPLFQGVYKAVNIDSDEQLLHVSRYIHRNPTTLNRVDPSRNVNPIVAYPYSSYPYFRGQRHAKWIHPDEILHYFGDSNVKRLNSIRSYQAFVEEPDFDEAQTSIENILIDQDALE